MRRQELLYKTGHCCRVFMITLLLLLALVFIQAIVIEIYRTFYIYNRKSPYQVQRTEAKPLDRSRSNRLFLPDGTTHFGYIDYGLPEDQRARIYDTNDTLIWQGKDNELPERYLKWPGSLGRYSYTYSLRRYRAIYPDPRRSIVVPVLNDRQIDSLWRFEVSGGYFAGFDRDGNRIGYCGSAGFVQEESLIKPLGQPVNLLAWIPIQGGGPVVLWPTEHSIYQIDFRKQSVESLIQLTDKKITGIGVHGWMKLTSDSEHYLDDQKYRSLIVCRTDEKSVIAILRDPAETIRINMPEESNARLSGVTATNEKIYMRALDLGFNPPKEIAKNSNAYAKWIQERMKKPVERADELYEVNSAGDLTLLNKFEWTFPPRQITSQAGFSQEKLRRALRTASPAFYDLFGGIFFRLFRRPFNNYNRDLFQLSMIFLHFAPSYNPVSYLLSALMAGIVLFHAWPRRTSTAGLIGWIVFAGLFNIIGLLVYLALNHTPAIQCHKCNKRRGLSSPQCPHCGADLQIIAPDMLNIIAGAGLS